MLFTGTRFGVDVGHPVVPGCAMEGLDPQAAEGMVQLLGDTFDYIGCPRMSEVLWLGIHI